ncbi:hypothetical protein [Halobaculum magnesiiphilum]|uniref:Peptidase S54 rhomboid domain-containing protein n=1 Tax=Halobaculum magnesiiphilum TaxID=1017351 RepID=A0A8T8WH79_9EURY|nr:hypothetical protein [Halobaculum magnesiiphilum]QZP39201.1 hypothetical protein K6T50_16195 [Halobaculum magnesiiphilum]
MKSPVRTCQERKNDYWKEVLERVHIIDFALILAVPSIITAAYLLPASIQQSLVLEYGNPSLFNIWSASYVHRGFDHFSNNLVAYILYIVPTYLLFISADRRKLFWYSFVSFLICLPPVIALLNIAVIGQGSGAGFSGIGAAFMGLLLVASITFVRYRVLNDAGGTTGTSVFLMALGFTAWIYTNLLITMGILVVSALLLFYEIHSIGFDQVRGSVSELNSNREHVMLVIVAFALFLSSPTLLFPKQIVQDGNAVNIFSHYIGLVFGFFVPTVLSIYWEHSQEIFSPLREKFGC